MSKSQNHGTAGAEQYPSGKPRGGSPQLVRYQRQHPQEYFAAMNAVQHDTQRRIVHAIVHGLGDATYSEIRELSNVGDRTIRKHVSKLEENGLVERRRGWITMVVVESSVVLALLEHALECYYARDA